jgi:hypothetical protein
MTLFPIKQGVRQRVLAEIRRQGRMPPLGGINRIIRTINSYQAVASSVHIGGLAQSDWLDSGTISNSASTFRTIIDPSYAVRQNCYLTSVKIQIANVVADAWSFRVYRWNGGTSLYDFVAKQDFTAVIGTQTITLSPPILVQPGDIPGFMFPGDATQSNWVERTTITHDPLFRYVDVDVLTSNAFGGAISNTWHINMELFTTSRPYLAVSGDSIMSGNNGGNLYYAGLENTATPKTTPGGDDQNAEMPYILRGLVGDGSLLQYQNLACGGQTWAWVASTALAEINAVQPNTLIVHCGINDVFANQVWADILPSLTTIKAGLNAGMRLMIDEILPSTDATDAQAANVRDINTHMAAWCTANGATLILCHDVFGQTRISTGQLDDMIPTLTTGGTHLSLSGVAAMAAIYNGYL